MIHRYRYSVLLVSAMACALSACAFEPVHGRAHRAALAKQIESVQLTTNPTRLGQLLKAEIETQINPAGQRAEKQFTLDISVSESETSLFIKLDGTSSRGDMVYSSNYTLTRRKDGVVIDTGSINRISSYNISENADYATYVSREDATKRGITELAQDYALRLSNLVQKLNDPNAKPAAPSDQPAPATLIRAEDNHEDRSQRN